MELRQRARGLLATYIRDRQEPEGLPALSWVESEGIRMSILNVQSTLDTLAREANEQESLGGRS